MQPDREERKEKKGRKGKKKQSVFASFSFFAFFAVLLPAVSLLSQFGRSSRRRIGRNTHHASNAAITFIVQAITNTACQSPAADTSALDSGTSNAAVPFAV